ncbi:MAG: hypothetical protein QXU92_04235 [Candidatus Diapherotrites archaeon]
MGKLKNIKVKNTQQNKQKNEFLEQISSKLKWLDPFTYVDLFILPKINPNNDKKIEIIVYLVSAFIFAYVLYNYVLAFLLGTQAPIVIVYSGSMEPTLYRGDVVFLKGFNLNEAKVSEAKIDLPISNTPLREFAKPIFETNDNGKKTLIGIEIENNFYAIDKQGPIIVYQSKNFGEDIIHRAVLKIVAKDGTFFLTLGDNNNAFDQDCPEKLLNSKLCISPYPIKTENIKGTYFFHIPLIGHLKLILFDGLMSLLKLFLK